MIKIYTEYIQETLAFSAQVFFFLDEVKFLKTIS